MNKTAIYKSYNHRQESETCILSKKTISELTLDDQEETEELDYYELIELNPIARINDRCTHNQEWTKSFAVIDICNSQLAYGVCADMPKCNFRNETESIQGSEWLVHKNLTRVVVSADDKVKYENTSKDDCAKLATNSTTSWRSMEYSASQQTCWLSLLYINSADRP